MNEYIRHAGMPLEDALLSGNDVVSCLARIATSTGTVELLKLMNAEVARNTETHVLLTAMAVFFVQVHSSVAAQFVAPAGIEATKRMFADILEHDYAAHAKRTQDGTHDEAAS